MLLGRRFELTKRHHHSHPLYHINDNGGTKTASDFSLLVNDTPVVSGTPRSFAAPAPVYTVSASPSSGYTATFSGSCDDSGKISLSPGDFKTCTITLNDTASAGSSSSSGSTTNTAASPNPSAPIQAQTPATSPISNSGLRGAGFTRDLQLHSVGDDVLSLQRYLNERGYTISVAGLDSTGAPRAGSPGNETSYFGLSTYNALIKFQAAHNLPQTGFFGPMTRELVNGAQALKTTPSSSFTRDLQLHDTGAEVKALQKYLNENGYTISQTGLDSTGAPRAGSLGEETDYFGLATYNALIKFQAAHNLPQSGFFGPMTREVMNR